MTYYNRLSELLNSTGIYKISEGTLINAELAAYAEGISAVKNGYENAFCNRFVHLCSDDEFKNRLNLLGFSDAFTEKCGKENAVKILLKLRQPVTLEDYIEIINLCGYNVHLRGIERGTDLYVVFKSDVELEEFFGDEDFYNLMCIITDSPDYILFDLE